jgi:hypothetical protein
MPCACASLRSLEGPGSPVHLGPPFTLC